MFNELRKVHIEEKRSNNISHLKEDFYVEVNQYIEKTKKKLNDDSDPAVRRELENCLKILNEVQKKRIEKIILYGFNEIYNGFDPLENLTEEEKNLYEEIKRDVTKVKKNFEKRTTKKKEDIIKVRVLKQVPKVKGPDGKDYGPFEEGKVYELPSEVGRLLINAKKSEMIK
jgi:DNA replication factor GINS